MSQLTRGDQLERFPGHESTNAWGMYFYGAFTDGHEQIIQLERCWSRKVPRVSY